VAPYIAVLDAFWQQVSAQQRVVLSSELTALQVLVGPCGLATPRSKPSSAGHCLPHLIWDLPQCRAQYSNVPRSCVRRCPV
jgi:hypothetical protein